MVRAPGDDGSAAAPDDRPADGWFIWDWLGAGSVTGLVILVLVGAYVVTPGLPDCPLYTAAGLTVCPWYRHYARSVAMLAGGVVGATVLLGLAMEAGRRAARRRRRP